MQGGVKRVIGLGGLGSYQNISVHGTPDALVPET